MLISLLSLFSAKRFSNAGGNFDAGVREYRENRLLNQLTLWAVFGKMETKMRQEAVEIDRVTRTRRALVVAPSGAEFGVKVNVKF
jgi:hypothetical protein